MMAAVSAACRGAIVAAGVRLVEAYYRVEVATSTRGLDAATATIKGRRGRILDTVAREGQDLFVITALVPVEACLSKRSISPGAGGGDHTGSGVPPAGSVASGLSFADELRRESSGAASASISLSHWERLQVRSPTGASLGLQYSPGMTARAYQVLALSCRNILGHARGAGLLQVDPHWKPVSEEQREEHGEDGTLLKNLAKRLANVIRERKGLPLIGAKVVEDGTKQRTRARKV
jgi:ribosome assembly protein 1